VRPGFKQKPIFTAAPRKENEDNEPSRENGRKNIYTRKNGRKNIYRAYASPHKK
jgi:hypothetical protein